MAAKLKACQEILPPPPRPVADTDVFAHQRRMQHLFTAAKSPSTTLRNSSITNGSLNISNVIAPSLSLSNSNSDKPTITTEKLTKKTAI